jgi:DNA-binding LacI/PurR family transcriptional regulator
VRGVPFTALFAYNDISAIGAMRAFQEADLRVPEDPSWRSTIYRLLLSRFHS